MFPSPFIRCVLSPSCDIYIYIYRCASDGARSRCGNSVVVAGTILLQERVCMWDLQRHKAFSNDIDKVVHSWFCHCLGWHVLTGFVYDVSWQFSLCFFGAGCGFIVLSIVLAWVHCVVLLSLGWLCVSWSCPVLSMVLLLCWIAYQRSIIDKTGKHAERIDKTNPFSLIP